MRKIKQMFSIAALMVPIGTVVASLWPVGTPDEATAIYRQPTWISVIKNDIGDNLYIAEVNTTSKRLGTVSINEDRQSVTYTSANATEDEFWYVLKDDQGRTNAAKVTVSISDNNWPTAANDSAQAAYGEAVTIPVLANDAGTGLKLVSVNEWSTNQGKVSISSASEVSYRQYGEPRGNQTDTFWYVFEDKWGRKNSAEVTVSVKEAKQSAWPTATPDFAEATSGSNSLIQVLDNDIGMGLSLKETNEWTQNGGKTVIEGSAIRYTTPANYSGVDAFWYVVEDNQGRTNSAKVEITVTGIQAKSVVEYCGNTYETDGTSENTSLSSLTAPPFGYPSTAIGAEAFENGQGRVSGRRYYVEGTISSGQSLLMEVAGVTSRIEEPFANRTISIIGAHADTLFYVSDNILFAHNGSSTKFIGNLFSDLGSPILNALPEDHVNTAIWVNGLSDDFFFSVINQVGTVYYKTYWRISGGFQGAPVKLASYSYRSGPGVPVEYTRRYDNFYFYNGFDYFELYTADSSGPNTVRSRNLYQWDGTAITNNAYGVFDRFTVSEGRLFITMSPWISRQPYNVQYISGHLFTVDNENGNLVEIASCETDHVEF